ncbi:c-type cytochrome [Acidovorax sp. CCYZU-2555]|uniref:c-type cytochrome n=1 Tax=Acidovorax sp. CCYZU-2555 TaxID=2835042 RepID=UPI0020BD4F02|nr:c-type cytochrome [Acidovorax sp. CCYZU-2555]
MPLFNVIRQGMACLALLCTLQAQARAADPAAGARIAARGGAACASCHGREGEGSAHYPPLAGQPAAYLQRQLQAMASGQRQAPLMGPVARSLSAQERSDVAAYYASLALAVKPRQGPLPTARSSDGAWLVERGRWADGIAACAKCHGPGGAGVGQDFPAIAHLTASYMQAQIDAWKHQGREAGPLGLMGEIARKLTPKDIEDIAAYYRQLHSAAGPTLAQRPAPAARTEASHPPDARAIPDSRLGEWIQRGEAIFTRTPENASGFAGNSLSCTHCHLDAGRLKNAAPLWGAYPMYPAYRQKSGRVETFAERVRGCFVFSLNGRAPDPGHDLLVALETYAYWMAAKAPLGERRPGAGLVKLAPPPQRPTFAAGQAVYAKHCALCHGTQGQGRKSGGITVFPALWGKDSYNWGAGMHEIDKAAGFIRSNMPYGQHNVLSEQQAWDVATFINSFERPQDPRFTGDVAQTRKQFHDTPHSMYGVRVNGKLLGTGP